MENRSIFIANLGHEFKTPLNAVLGFSQLGMSTESIDTCLEYFQKINLAARDMVCMINKMMDYAQVADPYYLPNYSNFHLHSLFNQLPHIFEHFNQNEGAELSIEIDDDVPGMFVCDPFRLEQAFTELIKNATTYSPGASMQVKISVISISDTEKALQMIFADSGKGIPEILLSDIFKPYHLLENSNQARYSGISLGLPFVYQIFERMKGSVLIENNDLGGLSVSMLLPILENDNFTTLPVYDRNSADNPTSVTPKNKNKSPKTIHSLDHHLWSDCDKSEVINHLYELKEYLDLKKPMHCSNFLEHLKKDYSKNKCLLHFIVLIEPLVKHYQFDDASNLLDNYMSFLGGEEADEIHK